MYSRRTPCMLLRWSVSKVADKLHAVAATVDGNEYDFVGNFRAFVKLNKQVDVMPKTWFTIQWPVAAALKQLPLSA